jgi:predicted ATPase
MKTGRFPIRPMPIPLQSVSIAHPAARGVYPFSVPAVRATETLEFTSPVTFLVGENGSGKSTLLEGLAAACKVPTVGSVAIKDDPTLAGARALAAAMRLSWISKGARTRRGFFLRAEDFFGFAKDLAKQRAELVAEIEAAKVDWADADDYARGQKLGPLYSTLGSMDHHYGKDLNANSHGEAFLKLFRARFVPNGIYLLDEPEAPLSPTAQLALLQMLQEMVAEGGQFVIATHSPILLAFPGAVIWSFDLTPPSPIPFDEIDHVRVTRDFLNAPERYLRYLREPHAADSRDSEPRDREPDVP